MSSSKADAIAAGLAHALDLRAARERQLALIAIAAGNAAARQAPKAAPAEPPPVEAPALRPPPGASAQILRLGLWRTPVEPPKTPRVRPSRVRPSRAKPKPTPAG
ncbi:hypothetical protein [Acidisoma sp. 7E03]